MREDPSLGMSVAVFGQCRGSEQGVKFLACSFCIQTPKLRRQSVWLSFGENIPSKDWWYLSEKLVWKLSMFRFCASLG